MIILFFLFCVSIYCFINRYKDEFFLAIGCASIIAFVTFLIIAIVSNIESSVEFEESQEVRKYIEYQMDNPSIRDDNFFEQLYSYNATIIKNQKYNKSYISTGIAVSNKWDTITPLKIIN